MNQQNFLSADTEKEDNNFSSCLFSSFFREHFIEIPYFLFLLNKNSSSLSKNTLFKFFVNFTKEKFVTKAFVGIQCVRRQIVAGVFTSHSFHADFSIISRYWMLKGLFTKDVLSILAFFDYPPPPCLTLSCSIQTFWPPPP